MNGHFCDHSFGFGLLPLRADLSPSVLTSQEFLSVVDFFRFFLLCLFLPLICFLRVTGLLGGLVSHPHWDTSPFLPAAVPDTLENILNRQLKFIYQQQANYKLICNCAVPVKSLDMHNFLIKINKSILYIYIKIIWAELSLTAVVCFFTRQQLAAHINY